MSIRPDVQVLIAGGGPVGLSLAALLANYGERSLVVEADDGYCSGSRAICISRRSLEELGRAGADRALVDKGLSWVGGRSHYRDAEVLHLRMPSEPTQRYAPMVNIQQQYIEQFAHEAAQRNAGLAAVRWSSRVAAVRPHGDHAEVDIESGGGTETLRSLGRRLQSADGACHLTERFGRASCACTSRRPIERQRD